MSALHAFLDELYDRYGDLGPNPEPTESLNHDFLVSENGALLACLARHAVSIHEASSDEEQKALIEELGQDIERFEQIVRRRLVP